GGEGRSGVAFACRHLAATQRWARGARQPAASLGGRGRILEGLSGCAVVYARGARALRSLLPSNGLHSRRPRILRPSPCSRAGRWSAGRAVDGGVRVVPTGAPSRPAGFGGCDGAHVGAALPCTRRAADVLEDGAGDRALPARVFTGTLARTIRTRRAMSGEPRRSRPIPPCLPPVPPTHRRAATRGAGKRRLLLFLLLGLVPPFEGQLGDARLVEFAQALFGHAGELLECRAGERQLQALLLGQAERDSGILRGVGRGKEAGMF